MSLFCHRLCAMLGLFAWFLPSGGVSAVESAKAFRYSNYEPSTGLDDMPWIASTNVIPAVSDLG